MLSEKPVQAQQTDRQTERDLEMESVCVSVCKRERVRKRRQNDSIILILDT